MEHGFLEALLALGEPILDSEGFMVYGPEKKRASEVLADVRKSKEIANEDESIEDVSDDDSKKIVEWDCCEEDFETRNFLENLLPSGYSYHVSKFKIDEESNISAETKFLAHLSVNICNEDAKEAFLKQMEDKTESSFRKSRKEKFIHPAKGGPSYTSNRHNCDRKVRHEKNRDEKQKGKNTDCPAYYSYKLFQCQKKHSNDDQCANLAMILSSQHNHNLSSTDAWNFLRVSSETKNRYEQLFEAGYTPSKARLVFVKELRAKLGETGYLEISGRRSVNPDSTTVFNLWTTYTKKFGSVNGPDSYLRVSLSVYWLLLKRKSRSFSAMFFTVQCFFKFNVCFL